jgi:hypothetical protein
MAQPRVYVHKDVNPPQNPAGLLKDNDVLMWEANLGGQPTTLIYEKNGWRQATPQEVKTYAPPEPAPEATPAPGTPPAPAPATDTTLGGTGAGTTRPTMEGTSAQAQAERNRARREAELQKAGAAQATQDKAAMEGAFAGLSIAERGQAEQLVRQGETPEAAAAAVKAKRNAGAQATALEEEPNATP